MLGKFDLFMIFFSSADFFPKLTFLKNYFRNSIIVLSSLDPDQAQSFVEPDLCFLFVWLNRGLKSQSTAKAMLKQSINQTSLFFLGKLRLSS